LFISPPAPKPIENGHATPPHRLPAYHAVRAMRATVQFTEPLASNLILHKLPNRSDSTNGERKWEDLVITHGVFDSEALNLMQAMLDQAWMDLSPDRRTAETRERIAQAVVRLAMQWERDPVDLGSVGVAERTKIALGVC
jgi:hypothetical protein